MRRLAAVEAHSDDLENVIQSEQDKNANLKAEIDALRKAQVITLAHDVEPFTPSELLRRAIVSAAHKYAAKRKQSLPFWSHVKELTSLGSNCSAGLARWAGYHPDPGTELIRRPKAAAISAWNTRATQAPQPNTGEKP